MGLNSLSSFLQSGLGPSSVIPGAPGFSSSASSSAGPSGATGGWQQTGAISFGGSGTGGATVGGAAADMGLPGTAGIGNLLSQYWPLLLVVGVVCIARRRKSR
jgi:hypothetical protein